MLIALTGFMASGKSSVGRALSSLLRCPFTDLDVYITEKQGRSIPEIFSSDGEAAFRAMELEALDDIISSSKEGITVLSLGGGTIIQAPAREKLASAVKVYLKASEETVRLRLGGDTSSRPMLRDGRLGELMAARLPIYESNADIVVDVNDADPATLAARIAKAVELL